MSKVPFKSKTITLNALLGVAMWIPPVKAWIDAHQFGPTEIATGLVVVNIILRFVTKGKIVLTK